MWEYRAALIKIIDADTLRLEIDQGMHDRTEEDIRLLAVSAPETQDLGGAEAIEFVGIWMQGLTELRWPLLVRTSPNRNPEPEERRTFIRYLGTVSNITNGQILNDDLREYLAQHPEWGSGV
jgi:hypothetical protein